MRVIRDLFLKTKIIINREIRKQFRQLIQLYLDIGIESIWRATGEYWVNKKSSVTMQFVLNYT